jgi:DNA-binding transcriptional regulator LsrR (DeoR family)
VQDKVERNRQIKGVQSSQSVVNDNKVLQLRRLYSSGGWTQADLCYVFGVSTTIVNRIINRKDWTHVQGEILV